MRLAGPFKKILIVCLRRLGDVLLTTPLAGSLKAAWPKTQIDWLVFEGTEGILQTNPAATNVITLSTRAGFLETFGFARPLFQHYDLALSAQAGDRPSLLARFAGKSAITVSSVATGGALRNLLFSAVVPANSDHRVAQILSLLEPLRLPALPELLTPEPDFSYVDQTIHQPFVVFHPGAAFQYKQWTPEGWRSLANRFQHSGYRVVITGGAEVIEKTYLNEVFQGVDVLRLDGRLSWSELVGLLIRAKYFVGVDTSVTHLAAACGTPGAAIYGPTDPALWGPSPYRGQQIMEVVQNNQSCIPCQKEGCERHRQSHSLCLDTLEAEEVWLKIAQKLV